jgi:hypothetical protein
MPPPQHAATQPRGDESPAGGGDFLAQWSAPERPAVNRFALGWHATTPPGSRTVRFGGPGRTRTSGLRIMSPLWRNPACRGNGPEALRRKGFRIPAVPGASHRFPISCGRDGDAPSVGTASSAMPARCPPPSRRTPAASATREARPRPPRRVAAASRKPKPGGAGRGALKRRVEIERAPLRESGRVASGDHRPPRTNWCACDPGGRREVIQALASYSAAWSAARVP